MNAVLATLTMTDERILMALLRRRRPRVDLLMRVLTKAGNWYVIGPVATLLALMPPPSLMEAAREAVVALVASHLLVQALKRTVCRERPDLPVGLGFLIEPEDRFSFPSGHATAALSVALPFFVAMTGPVAALVLVVALLVGVSRCYLGVHYPGDVAVGWALAAVGAVMAGSLPLV